jgi:putative FmdB family regulatory protein
MPTYEYRCKDCGEHLEVVQSFRDDALTDCPRCSGALKKVFQPIGIAFKGTGFYKTDSRSGSSGTSTSTSSNSSDSKTSSNGSSDSSSTSSSSSASGTPSSSSDTKTSSTSEAKSA